MLPLPTYDGKASLKLVRLNPKLRQKLRTTATILHTSEQAIIEDALKEYFEKTAIQNLLITATEDFFKIL